MISTVVVILTASPTYREENACTEAVMTEIYFFTSLQNTSIKITSQVLLSIGNAINKTWTSIVYNGHFESFINLNINVKNKNTYQQVLVCHWQLIRTHFVENY